MPGLKKINKALTAVDIPVNVTGTNLSFLQDKVHGSKTLPETGNITGDVTGALLGTTNLIIHRHSVAPTFDAKFKKLTSSGDYVINTLNYIFCQYIAPDEIIYSISQIS